MNKVLRPVLEKISQLVGNPKVFAIVVILIFSWLYVGFRRGFDDSWYSWLDAPVFILTFLMVFALQASQNADTQAIEEKLDEIIKALPQADNRKRHIEKEYKAGKREIK